MGLVKALIVTSVLYAILYFLRTRYISTLSPETQVTVLTWVPLAIIFVYLLL
jgi:hypothetical protein